MRTIIFLLALCVIPQNFAAAESLQIEDTKTAITVKQAGKAVVTYNKVSPPAPAGIDPIYKRSGCLHPIFTPSGRTVTEMFPADHAHQHGVYAAWVNTTYDGKNVDFWNLAKRKGRVRHERVVSKFTLPNKAGFEVDLIHQTVATAPSESPVEVLRERWKITAHVTDGSYHCFDLDTVQKAITDKPLTVNKFHYGGIALRGPTRWLTDNDKYAKNTPDLVREPSDFINNHRSSRKDANHQPAKWVALSGTIDGKPVSIAVLCHADNFRSQQPARIHPSKPYFCFAPCVNDEFVIDKDHPFKSRYRYLITDSKPDAEWLDQQWAKWCKPDVR